VDTDCTKLILFKKWKRFRFMILHFNLRSDTLIARVQNQQALPSASTRFVRSVRFWILTFRIAITRSPSPPAGQLPSLQHHQTLFVVYSNGLNFIAPDFKLVEGRGYKLVSWVQFLFLCLYWVAWWTARWTGEIYESIIKGMKNDRFWYSYYV